MDITFVIKKGRGTSTILDVGAGGRGVSEYLNSPAYNVFLLDIQKGVFISSMRTKNVQPIIGDGTRLPFKDKAIDFVISAATLEHIPQRNRFQFLTELKRVCKKKVILHFPVQSNDGLFKGKEYDLKLQEGYKRIFGFPEPYTTEHLEKGYPQWEETIGKVREIFPESKIIGRKNCDVWLQYRLFSFRPRVGVLGGLIYHLIWRKKDNKPPYLECMILYSKDLKR